MNFDFQPQLQGVRVMLRPLQAEDREALWEVARDPLIWALHPDKTRYEPDGFARFFADSLASRGALVVIDNESGQLVGSSRYYDWDPAAREVAIGYTFLARSVWGGTVNREVKKLMIRHAARWADRIWFHVAKGNLRSRSAMEKIGAIAVREGLRPVNGVEVPFIYYRIDAAGF
jgi:N-acetyltransferase